jgi:hypothetical protein
MHGDLTAAGEDRTPSYLLLTFAAVKRGKKTTGVVARGTFTLLGGTQAAAGLLGQGRFDVTVRPDGTMVYRGTTTAALGPVQGLSAACSELRAQP